MKIHYQHLINFLIDKPSIIELSEKLFQLGHEHEIEGDILNMEFTPNRGDCLSLYGLARDLNVFYETNLDIPIYKEDLPLLDLNFINHSSDKCPQISFLNIEIKKEISEYKDYLEDYFGNLKINKNNFFTDVSNYVAYELGQPTHCYEFSSIGSDITLEESNINSKFMTLLEEDVYLTSPDLVFSSEGEVINLSGIIGGKKTACSKETSDVLVECAYFKPEAIIGKAIKYNQHSDASHKFERGTDPLCHEKILRRFIKIVSEHAEIIKLELYSNNNDFKEVELRLDSNKVNNILGTNIPIKVYKDILLSLGFIVDKSIKVPSFRSDISHQNDLAEELARVVGYDNISITNINNNLNKLGNKLDTSNEETLKQFLVDKGFTEVINSPFSSLSYKDSIRVDNPLDSNRKYIRTNLTESLIDNLIYNEKRQKDSIKFFEISDIYTSSENICEKRLAIIISGRKGQNHIEFSQKLDKNYLIEIFNELNFDIDRFIKNLDRTKLKSKIKTPIFAIELKIDELLNSVSNYISVSSPQGKFIKYKPISEFPSSYKDFSFSVKNESKIDEVIALLKNADAKYLKKSFMFDFYVNKDIAVTKIGFRFIFQSDKKTLTDKDVYESTSKILSQVLAIDSVSMPTKI